MESPESWNLLVSSLAVSNLARVEVAWAFMVRHQLVRNAPGDSATFETVVRREIDLGPITGPTVAWRVANALTKAGIALPAGVVSDPWGTIAQESFREP